MRRLTDDPRYRELLAKLTDVQERLAANEAERQALQGQGANLARERQADRVAAAANHYLQTGELATDRFEIQAASIRRQLQQLHDDRRVLDEAKEMLERKLRDARYEVSRCITETNAAEFADLYRAFIEAFTEAARAACELRDFRQQFIEADVAIGFYAPHVRLDDLDINDVNSDVCREIRKAVEAGVLSGDEDCLDEIAWRGES